MHTWIAGVVMLGGVVRSWVIGTDSAVRLPPIDFWIVLYLEEARANLVEALTLFFEATDPSELTRRYRGEVFVTQVEVPVG